MGFECLGLVLEEATSRSDGAENSDLPVLRFVLVLPPMTRFEVRKGTSAVIYRLQEAMR